MKKLSDFWHKLVLAFTPQWKIYGVGHPSYYYREGDHIARIAIESTLGNPQGDFVIYECSIDYWMPPHDDEKIPVETRQMILEKMKESFEKEGTSYYVINNEDN